MFYYMRYWGFGNWATVIATIIVLILIVSVIICDIVNFSNEIDCGTVIDKHIFSRRYRGTMYRLTIEGEKNGRTVQYTFAVTEQEYDRYRIGDYYDRKGQ